MKLTTFLFAVTTFGISLSAHAGFTSSGGDPTGDVLCVNQDMQDAYYAATFHQAFEQSPSVTLTIPGGEATTSSATGICAMDEDRPTFGISCLVKTLNGESYWVRLFSENNHSVQASVNKIGDSKPLPLPHCQPL